MTARGKLWIGAILLGSFAPLAVWAVSRSEAPIVFLDGAPKVEVIARDRTTQSPWVDFGLPGFGQITYPRRYVFAAPADKRSAFAGYLRFSEDSYNPIGPDQTARIRVGSDTFPLEALSLREGGRTTGREWTSYYGIPYATEERFRDAVIEIGRHTSRVRLPLMSRRENPVRGPVQANAGPWAIMANPIDWKLSTAPAEYRLTIANGDGRRFLLSVQGGGKMILGEEAGVIATSSQGGQSSMRGIITELERAKLELHRDVATLKTEDGRVAYRDGRFAFDNLGFVAIDWLGNRSFKGQYLPRRSKPAPYADLWKRERIEVVGYRPRRTWTFTIDLTGSKNNLD